nr:hypothetical protein (leuA 5' region) - Haemophilus influenzae (strain Rd) [Haemophilus influenzae]
MPKNSLTASFLFVIWKTFYTEDFYLCFVLFLYLSTYCSHILCAAKLWIKKQSDVNTQF